MNSCKRLTIPMVVLFAGACGDEARISVTAALPSPLAVEMLSVEVRDVHRLIRWTPADFRPHPEDPGAPFLTTPEVETSTSGPDIEVTYQLESGGAVVSTGTVILPRKSDWRWGVSIFASTTNPQEDCFGCFGAQAFPLAEALRAPGQDSIWLVWGGNSIDDPAIY
jgi:hypothetical protein